MSKKISVTKSLTMAAVFSALYIVLTLVNPLSFCGLNIRIADILPAMGLRDKKIGYGISVGMIIANAFSPFGMIDVLCACVICIINFVMLANCRCYVIRSIILVITTSLFVSWELSAVIDMPFIISFLDMLVSQTAFTLIGNYIYSRYFKYFKKIHE